MLGSTSEGKDTNHNKEKNYILSDSLLHFQMQTFAIGILKTKRSKI